VLWEDGGGDPASYPIAFGSSVVFRACSELRTLSHQSCGHGPREVTLPM
jgi:hypothetical protein